MILRQKLAQKAQIRDRIRAFFAARGVLEVVTPVLGRGGLADPNLEPFAVEVSPPASGDKTLYLQTSPEVFMKRLLAQGSGPIYQISKSFRAQEAGSRHNPEFHMLEWYRPGFTTQELRAEVQDLLEAVLGPRDFFTISYDQAFEEHLGLSPHEASRDALEAELRARGVSIPSGFSSCPREDWLDLALVETVEPALAARGDFFLIDFPQGRSTLAATHPEDPSREDRFEAYVAGLEVANGFRELIDPELQAERYREGNRRRQSQGLAPLPVDTRFLEELSQMPPTAGVAVGVDRLMLLQSSCESLEDFLEFPWGRL